MEEIMIEGTNLSEEDSELLDGLFRAEYADMVNYAKLIVTCKHWAEDVVQETFAIGSQKSEDLRDSPNQVGWLYRTLQNLVLNKNREIKQWANLLQKVTTTPDSVTPKMVPSFEPEVLFNVGYKSLIRDADFEILAAYYCDGYSYKELAKRYVLSISGCKMRVMRAKRELKKALDKI